MTKGELVDVSATPQDIHAAMLSVMHDVGYVQKTGSMMGKYHFAGEADLIRALRPSMIAAGIIMYPVGLAKHTSETYTTSRDSAMNLDKVEMTFRFMHAPSGTYVDVQTMGAGADNGDKAVPKALTGALKYALRQAFMIETGDDPDDSDSDEQKRKPGGLAKYAGEILGAATTSDPLSVPAVKEAMTKHEVSTGDLAWAISGDRSKAFTAGEIKALSAKHGFVNADQLMAYVKVVR